MTDSFAEQLDAAYQRESSPDEAAYMRALLKEMIKATPKTSGRLTHRWATELSEGHEGSKP